jgi:DNA-binding NtrC family response regulator
MKILLVEDEKITRVTLARTLGKAGHAVTACETAASALEALGAGPWDVVLTDLKLPRGSGMDVLRAALEREPKPAVILMTAYASVETAVEAIKLGARDYLTKPFSPDQLLHRLQSVAELKAAKTEVTRLRKTLERTEARPLIGASAVMRRLKETLAVVAARDTTVLIEGESGTGKELVARELHRLSDRASGPFVAVNCAAIPETLLESELFGHEKGSFSGATGRHEGYFERADKGTIFVDDIDDFPVPLQVKLLRVLQEREFLRVGGRTAVHVDIRVVCATKARLADLVKRGKFREDLYYRLAIVPLRVPPLRERREDLPALLDHFFTRYRAGTRARSRLAALMPSLLEHSWPGNVRELENVAQRIIALPEMEHLDLEDVSPAPASALLPVVAPGGKIAYRDVMEAADRQLIQWALDRADGQVSAAAELLELPRSTLRSKIEKYGLTSTDS